LKGEEHKHFSLLRGRKTTIALPFRGRKDTTIALPFRGRGRVGVGLIRSLFLLWSE